MNDKKLMIKSKGILNQIGLLGVIAVLCIIFTCLNSTFIAAANLMNIVRQSAVMIIVAMGVTFVMISGELDLSIGGVACLTGMVVSKLLTSGVSIPVAILIGLLLGALLGLFNGILTTKFNLPSMIVTLATMNLANGSASLITGGTAIYNLPQEFEFLGRGFIFGIPAQVVFMVILVIICGIVLSKTLIGRYALAIGGNADVSSSTKMYLNELSPFSKDNYKGRNINFGVREHAMAAIANGLALAGYRPFVSTFLSFSDYLKPALRLSALMNLPVTYIFTHDSISIGQDGPTHQPVEQLVSLRATPNLEVFRPADSNEVIGSFKTIFENNKPSCLILGRDKIKILETTSISATSKGAYIVHNEERKLDGIIIATGEEVTLALSVMKLLKEKGYDLRVISMPSIERYNLLTAEEKEELFPVGAKKFVIEKGSSYSWYSFVYKDSYLFTLDKFGTSGTKEEVDSFYGFTKEEISLKIEALLK